MSHETSTLLGRLKQILTRFPVRPGNVETQLVSNLSPKGFSSILELTPLELGPLGDFPDCQIPVEGHHEGRRCPCSRSKDFLFDPPCSVTGGVKTVVDTERNLPESVKHTWTVSPSTPYLQVGVKGGLN